MLGRQGERVSLFPYWGGKEHGWVSLGGITFDTSHGHELPLASKWKKALKADEKMREDYAKEKGDIDKGNFRANWAKLRHEEWKEDKKKTHVESHSKESFKNLKYLSLKRIAREEGGGREGRG